MNKDAILATIIGFIIGLFITGMLFVGPKIAQRLPKMSFTVPNFSLNFSKSTPTAIPTPKVFSLTVSSPLADSIESENEVLVSGITDSQSIVVIEGNADEITTKVNDDGKYAGKISLVEGKNDVVVTSYNKDRKAQQTVTVFYTPEEF